MSRLLRRELRRMLPPGLAMLGLGLSVLLLLFVPTLMNESRRGLEFDVAFLIVAIGTPWLMGSVAVAPDSETGAEAFLRSLPVSRRRLLAVRWLAAASWCGAVVVAFALCCEALRFVLEPAFEVRLWREEFVVVAAFGAAVMFPAGALSSVLCRQTLLAFVIAPLLCLAPAFAFGWTAMEFGLPEPLLLFVPSLVLPCLLLGAAYWAYTRLGVERVRGVPRPVALVSAVTLGTLVLGGGLSTAAYALDRGVPQWHFQGAAYSPRTPSGSVAVVLQAAPRFNWSRVLNKPDPLRHLTYRCLVLRPESRDDPWVLPDLLEPVAFSPDGRRLLGFNSGGQRWELLDLEARTRRRDPSRRAKHVLQLDRRHRYLTLDGVVGGTRALNPVLWSKDGQPWLTDARGVHTWDGSRRLPWPEGTVELEAAWGDQLVLRDRTGGLRLWDLSGAAPKAITLPPLERIEAGLAGQGRYLLVLGRNKAGTMELWSVDLEPGNAVQLGVDLSGFGKELTAYHGISVDSSPDRRRAIVQVTQPPAGKSWIHSKPQPPLLVELGRGTTFPVPLGEGGDVARAFRVITWSQTGKRVVTSVGVWRVGEETLEDTRDFFSQVLMFLDDDRLLLRGTEYDFRTRVRSDYSGIRRHERRY